MLQERIPHKYIRIKEQTQKKYNNKYNNNINKIIYNSYKKIKLHRCNDIVIK